MLPDTPGPSTRSVPLWLHAKVNGAVPDADAVNDAAPPSATVTFCGWAVMAGATTGGSVDTRLVGLQAREAASEELRAYVHVELGLLGRREGERRHRADVTQNRRVGRLQVAERDIVDVPAFRPLMPHPLTPSSRNRSRMC